MMENEYKILVVDDDEDVLFATVRILKSEGYDVIYASSGEEALEMLVEKPDLVVLDVVMDGMNGHEVCRRIKANPAYSHVFIVFASGTEITAQSQSKGLNLGADGYIVRPFTRQEFLAKVKAFIRLIKVQKELAASEKWLEITINSMADGVIVTDSEGKINFMNPMAEKITGYSFVDVISRHADSILHLKDSESNLLIKEVCGRFLQSGARQQEIKICELFPSNGLEIYVSVFLSAIYASENKNNGIVVLLRDETERMQAQIKLKQYQNNLENLVKERTEELEKKNAKLESHHKLFIEREFRVKALRDELADLKLQLEFYTGK